MKAAATFALSVLALLPFVSAHGYVSQVTIDGTSYKGNTPGSSSVKSAIRMIDDVSPVKGATNKYLSCGQNAQKASTVATASPGSKVSFKWSAITGGNWFHNVGPLMTYMASCGTASCTSFNSSGARWFKIAQAGLQSDGTWAQAALLTGAAATVTLPSNIAPGEYLIRHEIIALHTAMTSGGAEFYPSCTQLKIGGSKTGTPNATVSFPGAYKDSDAGILVDVYDLVGSYVFPGPAISNLSGKTSVATSNTTTTASDSETSTSSATSSTTTTVSRRVSRVMRAVL
ncbi:glycoside hydrolase [Trametes versicolor FP-101664 SS1]|uniref:glycoside hydrolase n=1 Tax=Trametes versicolor (strain FP-101664) TaxID=717944 RepID=UPI000462399D|nr:glycoside hydrolase [Trametes versicolor FP-101664 SS1]EIW52776.1 glycoside hydrolase [Trametes versicolor FP-101664 SS1]